MPTFSVKVRATDGKIRVLELPAASEADARAYAKRNGTVLSAKKRSSWTETAITPADRQVLFSRLAAMLKSRMGTSEALKLMRDTFKGSVGRICGRLLATIEATGCDLANAMDKVGAPDFPRATTALVKAGAKGGATATALQDAARFEWEVAHIQKGSLKSIGMAIVSLVGALCTNIASTHYLGPQIAGSGLISAASKLKNGIDTAWVHTASDIMSVMIAVVLTGLLFLMLLAGVFKRVIPVLADQVILRIPFYKELILAQTNFVALYGLSVLVRAGINIEEALRLSAEATPKGALRSDLEAASKAVTEGKRWPEAMHTLHPTDKAALAFSVDRHQIADTLSALAEQYNEQYKLRVETVGPMLQLVGAVFLVGSGGVMFAETVLPMLQASSNLL